MASLATFKRCLRIDRRFIFLKLAFFLVYSVWFSVAPYVNIISTEVVSYEQLAVLFAFIPVISVAMPIIVGFIADKTGNYKVILIGSLVCGMAANSVILWLRAAATETVTRVGELQSDFSRPALLLWNGTSLQLHTWIDLSNDNITAWSAVSTCHVSDESDDCVRQGSALTRIQLARESPRTSWVSKSEILDEAIRSCHQLRCTVSIENVTWTTVTTRMTKKDFIFPVLLIIRLISFISVDAVAPLLDATGLYMCKAHNGDFARQKMWVMFSMLIVPFVCGALIDLFEQYKGYKEYGLAFAIGGIAILTVAPVIWKLDIQVQKNSQSILKTAKAVGKMADVNAFLLVEMVMGLCWGFHFNFLPVYLNTELKASKTVLGMAMSANGIGGMILLAIGTTIVNWLGPSHTVAVALLLTCSKFIIFYFLLNPWIVLAIESVDGFCNFLAFLAGSYFCAAAAPPGMLGSVNGLLSAAVSGAGRGIGTTVGSALIPKFGIRAIYLSFGIVAGSTSVVYMLVYHSVLKKYERRRLETGQNERQVQGVDNSTVDSGETPNNEKHRVSMEPI